MISLNIFEMKLHLHENTAEGVNSCFLSCCTVSVTATFLFFSFLFKVNLVHVISCSHHSLLHIKKSY